MVRAYEMNHPPLPPAFRKMIYKEQNYFTERKALPVFIKLLDYRNAKEVLMIIFDYLYMPDTNISGIDLFKIAMLNSLMFNVIKKFYYPMKLSDFGRNHHYFRFMNIITREPDFDKMYKNDIIDETDYKENMLSIIYMKKAFQSKVFGGSIFAMRGGFRNPLSKNLYEVRNIVVGYYDLRNVRISNDRFVDIQIIISDPTHQDVMALTKIKKWHNRVQKILRSG